MTGWPLMLPNGPEMAVAILTVEACAVCAPLNPAYGVDEVDRYFDDLRPRALITQAGMDLPACRGPLSRGVRVLELSTALDAQAGLFTLAGDKGVSRPTTRSAQMSRAACFHVRHNVATEDCPVDTFQHLYVGVQFAHCIGTERG